MKIFASFFNNYRFYTVSPEKRLVLKPEYKKLENREYLIHKFDENLVLLKPFIEHVSANFVKFETDEEEIEINSHLNHYYYFDEDTKTLKVDEARKISYQIKFHLDAFREYREEAFKKWDIIKSNSLIGLADPITQEEKDWYLSMLNFTDSITIDSTPDTWPVIPERFR